MKKITNKLYSSEYQYIKTYIFFNFRYVFTNFVQVSLEEEFLDVPKEIIVKILSSEDLRVDTEYQVFLASMAWLDHDVGGRRRYVFDVLVRKKCKIFSWNHKKRNLQKSAITPINFLIYNPYRNT